MEKRLIDLDANLKRLEKEPWWSDEVKSCIRMFLAKAKVVDAVPVVHGRWEMKTVWKGNETWVAVCSACKTYSPVTEVAFQDFPYCPHCGASMKDGDENV